MPTENQISNARARWDGLWNRFGVHAPTDGTFEELVTAYGDDERHYHTFDHVLDCLELLDDVQHLANRPQEVEAAIWFHDAVYDTRRGDNEEASANWSTRVLSTCGVPTEAVERVGELILRTRHHDDPCSPDEALFLDIDLSILGRDRGAFETYQDQIHREFNWVPADAFRAARTRVLKGFLEQERIFRTELLCSRYEQAARSNLQAALLALESEASQVRAD